MKRIFSCILLLILTLCTAITLFGCATGLPTEDFDKLYEKWENGEISDEEFNREMQNQMAMPLYGVKVLYRPLDYDWENNPGVDDQGHSNARYYGRFGHNVLRGLDIKKSAWGALF